MNKLLLLLLLKNGSYLFWELKTLLEVGILPASLERSLGLRGAHSRCIFFLCDNWLITQHDVKNTNQNK